MKWLALVLVAVGLVGCGEASPAGVTAMLDADGGSDGIARDFDDRFPSGKMCQDNGNLTPGAYRPCDPQTGVTVLGLDADGGVTSSRSAAYSICGQAVSVPCLLSTTGGINGELTWSNTTYCVATCPAVTQ